MRKMELGNTDLKVSALGLGLSELGSDFSLSEAKKAASVLNTALDSGINFLDTAACYGTSEVLIGKTIADRRQDYVLSTKAGHLVDEPTGMSWTAKTVRESIERSLQRMRTDYLDVVHLHSCDVTVLEEGEVIHALQDAKRAGKTRFIGYSGDNESAHWAVESGLFDTLQTSYNLVDQKARFQLLPRARQQGMGIIAKRPIANAAWGAQSIPSSYAQEYFRRAKKMIDIGPLPEAPDNPILLALGFVFASDLVDTAIVGSTDPEHIQTNIQLYIDEIPISSQTVNALYERFDKLDSGWLQQG